MIIDIELINNLTTEIVTRHNKIKSVYESIETPEHYDSFRAMCDNHLVYCNTWIERIKPKFKKLQRKRNRLYEKFYVAAKYSIDEINEMISQYESAVQAQAEELKMLHQIETRCSLEHNIAIEYQDKQYKKARKEDKKKPIGFVVSKPKKTRKKKDE